MSTNRGVRVAYRRWAEVNVSLLLPLRHGPQRDEVREKIRDWLRAIRRVKKTPLRPHNLEG